MKARARLATELSETLVCDFFVRNARLRHASAPTPLRSKATSTPSGTAFGLDIHEKSRRFRELARRTSTGSRRATSSTIEPGLYFPTSLSSDREIGVRIEDTFVVERDGWRGGDRSARGGLGLEA